MMKKVLQIKGIFTNQVRKISAPAGNNLYTHYQRSLFLYQCKTTQTWTDDALYAKYDLDEAEMTLSRLL